MNKDWKDQLTQILDRLGKLETKYAGMGQDMLSYLDGLYYSNGLNYWEYTHLDSLLGLQTPRTPFKDEMIFIIYHQITELMFKLCKHELLSLTEPQGDESEYLQLEMWQRRMGRVNNYFRHLSNSFDIMMTGMDMEEFRKFRMALLPASGFQSVQFRQIEIMSTNLQNLIRAEDAPAGNDSISARYPFIYWKQGGIDLETGTKTLTLREFENKYDESLVRLIEKFQTQNLAHLYQTAPPEVREDESLQDQLREYDQYVNVYWKLSHLSAAAKHLVRDGAEVDATGGTNWRTFLPPRFQRVIFFPELWTAAEREEWGRAAVVKEFNKLVSQGWMKGE
ncbi:MAG: tryptophan 2,3-dioxygenase family protein [Bacteroidota bacterium]